MIRAVAVVFACVLVATSAAAAEPEGGSALAAGAAVVPGLLIHGAGHFALGERPSAYRLLLMQGVGLVGMAGGLGMLTAVGGSDELAPLYVPMLVGGLGLFGVSFLADLVGSLHGTRPWAVPVDPSGFRLRAGYAGLFASKHDFGHLGKLGAGWWGERLSVDAQATLHFEGAYRAYRGLAGWTLWTRADDPVTRLRIAGELGHQDFYDERMSLTTARVFTELRWNLGGWVKTMKNAYLHGRLGVGLDAFGYEDAPVSHDALPFLVVDLGLGMNAGGRVEVELAYRQRKGELPGGIALSDGLAGFAGMLALTGRVSLSERFALLPEVMLGTGVMACLGIEARLF